MRTLSRPTAPSSASRPITCLNSTKSTTPSPFAHENRAAYKFLHKLHHMYKQPDVFTAYFVTYQSHFCTEQSVIITDPTDATNRVVQTTRPATAECRSERSCLISAAASGRQEQKPPPGGE